MRNQNKNSCSVEEGDLTLAWVPAGPLIRAPSVDITPTFSFIALMLCPSFINRAQPGTHAR